MKISISASVLPKVEHTQRSELVKKEKNANTYVLDAENIQHKIATYHCYIHDRVRNRQQTQQTQTFQHNTCINTEIKKKIIPTTEIAKTAAKLKSMWVYATSHSTRDELIETMKIKCIQCVHRFCTQCRRPLPPMREFRPRDHSKRRQSTGRMVWLRI